MPTPASEEYEVLALRYATSENRVQSQNFLKPDDHSGSVSPLDFYIFVIRNNQRTIVIDTGFDPASGQRRGRQLLRTPAEALRQIGIEAETVQNVILTHMHWDHAGGIRYFPRAKFHLQAAEMSFCTGPCMCHRALQSPFDVEHVVDAVRAVYAERVCFHDKDSEFAPGITLHLIGGHSGGIQAIRVLTARGYLVLAGDTTHLWANLYERNPFPVVVDVAKVLDGYVRLELLADGPDLIIPGHDPLILKRFPAVMGCIDVVRLDLSPTTDVTSGNG